MNEASAEATVEMATDLEWIAREIAGSLESVVAANDARTRSAERHLLRLRFSLARVKELQDRVARTPGVFEPARLEVAISVLDTHVTRAEGFIEQIAPHPQTRRTSALTADADATTMPAGDLIQERAA
jgi:hypothetical protein